MENPKGGPLGAEEAVYAIYPKVYCTCSEIFLEDCHAGVISSYSVL